MIEFILVLVLFITCVRGWRAGGELRGAAGFPTDDKRGMDGLGGLGMDELDEVLAGPFADYTDTTDRY